MVTAGAEGLWKVWDMRKWGEPLHLFRSYGAAVADIDISMTGVVAVAFASHLHMWKQITQQSRPERVYLKEEFPGKILSSVRFRPFEDVLGVGHSGGFCGLLVPGAGVANFDSFEANPFETKKQRQEKEVRGLLEKLQPDTIMLDTSHIGSVNAKVVQEYYKEQEKKKREEEAAKKKEKKKQRGKNK